MDVTLRPRDKTVLKPNLPVAKSIIGLGLASSLSGILYLLCTEIVRSFLYFGNFNFLLVLLNTDCFVLKSITCFIAGCILWLQNYSNYRISNWNIIFSCSFYSFYNIIQGHPTDYFGAISVRKTCNRLKFSVREMSSRAFLINAFLFSER